MFQRSRETISAVLKVYFHFLNLYFSEIVIHLIKITMGHWKKVKYSTICKNNEKLAEF